MTSRTPTTIVDLARLSLTHGEGARLDLPVHLDPLELGGQTYAPRSEELRTRLDVSRPSNGYAFRLRFPIHVEGPCMRCLDPAAVETEVDAREVDQADTDDEELRSPYVVDDELDLGRWAHDAAVLAIPARILCRPDCAGLCPTCGESLNDADPEDHKHDTGGDSRWSKLNELKLD
ncbi:MAG TPA: YceD family protein [Solirubrobacterales bacterium]